MRKRKRNSKLVSFAGILSEPMERRLLMSTYTVNTVSDAVSPVAGLLTLRQAVADANGNPGANTITFDPSVFAAGSLHTVTLIQGPILFTDTAGLTTVDGPGASVIDVSGNQSSQVFQVPLATNVSIGGITISGGAAGSSAGFVAMGGGIQNSGVLTLTNVTMSDNIANGGDGQSSAGGAAYGGGIYSNGTLSLVDCSVTGNAVNGGLSPYNCGGNSSGSGIYSTGSLTISGSSIIGNNATGGAGGNPSSSGDFGGGIADGGGIYSVGQTAVNSSNVSNNTATGGAAFGGGEADGGGIYVSASANFAGDTFNHNEATGGSDPSAEGGGGGDAWGGAVYAASAISISNSTLSGNTSVGGAGTDQDYGPAGNASGGAIAALGGLTISGSTISSNNAYGGDTENGTDFTTTAAQASGGGIYAAQLLDVTDCTVSMNAVQGSNGGGRDASGGGLGAGGGITTLGTGTISETTVAGNIAVGGIGTTGFGYTVASPFLSGDGEGGGVNNAGSLTVVDSTISGNNATGGVGAVPTVYSVGNEYPGGGGDGLGAGIFSSSLLSVEDSTITANVAGGGEGGDANGSGNGFSGGNGGNGEGGAIDCATALELFDSTVVQNSATGGTGGVTFNTNGYVGPNGASGSAEGGGIFAGNNSVLDNSIVSANNGASGADIYSSLSTTSGFNLIGYGGGLTNGVNGNKIGIHDPLLAALANNGGSTETMLPVAGSPVIDAGGNSLIPTDVATDQRGDARISNATVDIGAVEVQQANSAAPAPVITLTAATTQTATAGASSAISLGSFTASNATGPFTVMINWGDGTASQSATMAAAGTIAARTHTFSSAGTRSVTVSVTDAKGDASNAESFELTVAAAATTAPPVVSTSPTTTTLRTATAITATGTEVKLIASVSGGGAVPTGTVTFSENGTVLTTESLQAGSAEFETNVIAAGSDQFTVGYGGDTSDAGGVSPPQSVPIAAASFISAAFTKPVFKPAVIAGEPFNARLPLVLMNTGPTVHGPFSIRFYVNTTDAIDGGQVLLSTLARTIGLRAKQRIGITRIIASLPASLPAGSYFLLAEVTDPSGLVSLTTTATTVGVAAPIVKLSASVGAVTPSLVTMRRPGFISITITNSGNIAASGLLDLTVSPSADGSAALPVVLASVKIRVSIGPERSRTIRIRVRVPELLNAGRYFPWVSFSLNNNETTAVGSAFFMAG